MIIVQERSQGYIWLNAKEVMQKKKYPEFWYGMDDDCGLEESKKASRRK